VHPNEFSLSSILTYFADTFEQILAILKPFELKEISAHKITSFKVTKERESSVEITQFGTRSSLGASPAVVTP